MFYITRAGDRWSKTIMIWILAVVGAIAGLIAAEIPGMIGGALLGFLLGVSGTYRERIARLERRVRDLEESQASVSRVQETQNKEQVSLVSQQPVAEEPVQPQPETPIPETPKPATPVTETPVTTVSESVDESATKATTVDEGEPEPVTSHKDNPWIVDSSKSEYLSRPSLIDKLIEKVKQYFSEGNLIVRVGVVVLFFGVSFLVKYSIDHALIPIELRLAGVFIGGIVMLATGWYLREKKTQYALIMQGGAVAIMYLTIFASYKLYHLISPGFTFPLLIVFSILSMVLAVLQNSRALAVTAITGGFISPILASTGSNDYISLFSYYLVLNLSIFAVSWFKSWRLLNVIGFWFTFVIGTLWGVTSYRAANFTTTEPFLIAFFLIYVAISILFAIKQKPELKGYVDGTLVFGVPLVGFGLQAALVHNMEYGLAISAFCLGLFYLTVVKVLWNNSNSNFRLLCEAMLAIGVIFTTLTIPFALDGRWTAASWAIEGAGFIWVGLKQQRKLVVMFGILIQAIGGLLYLIDYPYYWRVDIIFLNTEYMGAFIVSVAGMFSAYLFNHKQDEFFKEFRPDILFMLWGLCWWYFGGLVQVDQYLTASNDLVGFVLFFVVSALIAMAVTIRYRWQQFNFHPWLLLVPLVVIFLMHISKSVHIRGLSLLVWLFAFCSAYLILYIASRKSFELLQHTILHTVSYLLPIAVLSYQVSWWLSNIELADSWQVIATAAVIVSALQVINKVKTWPFTAAPVAYQLYAAVVLVASLMVWSIGGNFLQFLPPTPLPYIPLINPVDIMQVIILITVFDWYRKASASFEFVLEKAQLTNILAGFLFIWFNVVLFKTLHVIDGVQYRVDTLFESSLVQTSVSISWTIIGLVVMVLASRKLKRHLWITGAVITGVVVAKLFLLDLSDRGTIERIVSFMVVGILLLVVGYFSPVPPAKVVEQK